MKGVWGAQGEVPAARPEKGASNGYLLRFVRRPGRRPLRQERAARPGPREREEPAHVGTGRPRQVGGDPVRPPARPPPPRGLLRTVLRRGNDRGPALGRRRPTGAGPGEPGPVPHGGQLPRSTA